MAKYTITQLADSLSNLVNAHVQCKDANLFDKETLDSYKPTIKALFDKLVVAVANIDAEEAAPPVQEAAQSPAMVGNSFPDNPMKLSEPDYFGKTLAELKSLNTWDLKPMCHQISKSLHANPNVPTQGQSYEEDWRQAMVHYITSNYGYYLAAQR